METFEEIYRAYFDDVYRYLCRLSGDADVAEEITSQTFFRAMRALGSFRGDCDTRVWLCQIARNCYRTYLKDAGRTEALELQEPPADEKSVEEQVIDGDDAGQIRQILHGLPEPYREVFMWRVFAELSFRQIGRIFGKSENWACVTYHRAKKQIQSELEESS